MNLLTTFAGSMMEGFLPAGWDLARIDACASHPAEAVTPDKIARIRRLAGQWLSANQVGWCELRFDVIAIWVSPDGDTRLRHFERAF